jgi:hypothetical protein
MDNTENRATRYYHKNAERLNKAAAERYRRRVARAAIAERVTELETLQKQLVEALDTARAQLAELQPRERGWRQKLEAASEEALPPTGEPAEA